MEDFVAKLSQDERPVLKEMGLRLALAQRIGRIGEMEAEEREQLIGEVAAMLQDDEVTRQDLGMAMQTAGALEDSHTEAAIAAYNLFAKYVEAAADPTVAAYAEAMRGSARRIGLPGNPIEISGQTIAGEKFDISQYKDKVVLVDFWATWCGPCIRELPNLLDNYAKYHGKGFGWSHQPRRRRRCAAAVRRRERDPWITIFNPEEGKAAGRTRGPLLRHHRIRQSSSSTRKGKSSR